MTELVQLTLAAILRERHPGMLVLVEGPRTVVPAAGPGEVEPGSLARPDNGNEPVERNVGPALVDEHAVDGAEQQPVLLGVGEGWPDAA